MTPLPSPLGLLSIFALVHLIQAQCATSGYVFCPPAGAGLGGIPQDNAVNSELYIGLTNAGIVSPGRIRRRDLASRQAALCCPPTDECLVVPERGTPFCYVSTPKAFSFFKRSYLDNCI